MIALVAAAAIAAGPTILSATEWTPNLYRVPAGCADARHNVVDRFGRPLPLRLGDLPAAGPMLLVNRTIDGCPVITMMHGELAPVDNPNPPGSAYRLRPLAPQPAE